MKKIIYSLVIMIAAGSLFTSCIEPVEPAGIFDLREAKARYYDALSKLRAADAELVLAQADHEKADAEFRRAEVENQNLLNEYQRLLNEAKALDNEKEVAKWAMLIEELQKQHELNMIDYEQKIAEANEKLRQALSKIEMAMLDLTDAEKTALTNAITRYENAYQKWLTAKENVTAAEAALWQAQYDMDNVTDSEGIYFEFYGDYIRLGEGTAEYYQDCIDYYTMVAAYYAAMYEEMAENSDYADWAAELESLKAERDAAKYDRYIVTKDSVEYMMNVFHDGVLEFELAVNNWLNDEDNAPVADPGKAPAEPKESNFKAADYQADSIKFPVLEYTTPNQAYDKFLSLISSYETVNTLVGDTSNFVIVNDAANQTITLVANQQMKDFVLGTAAGTTGSQKLTYYDKNLKKNVDVKADYGLNGAISVLERVLVLDKKGGKSQEELEKDAEDALKAWKADRDSIIALYDQQAAKKPIAQAYQPLKDALDALKQAKDDANSNSGSLVKAAEDLIEKLNGMITHSDMSTADSIKLTDALVEFAKSRAAYLDYTPYENGTKYDNKNLFYYAYATSPDVLVDSIDFTKLTFDLIREKKGYGYDTDGNPTGAAPVECFYNIANQLLGNAVATAINGPWPQAAIADATVLNYDAFYGEYQYTAGTPAKIEIKGGGDYTPKAVTEAIAGVQAATDELNNLWDRFWKENLGATCDANGNVTIPALDDKYDPRVYELESFTKPFNVVVFDGANINWTAAIGAILGSVDPNKGLNDGSDFEVGGYVSGAAIFEGTNGTTDFYDYMYAAWLAENNDTTEEIAKLKEWVAAVVAAFEKDVTDAEAAAKKAYEDAVKNYDKNLEKYNKAKAAYDAYMTALKAFVGVDEDGNPINVVKNSAGAWVPAITTIAAPVDYKCAQVKQTQTGAYEWDGEWILGGEQLALAEQYLPDFPENLVTWRHDAAVIDHKLIHLNAIIDELEKAYLAAAAVYDESYMSYYGFETIEEYFEDYLEYFQGYYEMALALISIYQESLDKFNAGYDPAQINLEIVEDLLAMAQLKLADAEVELAAAQAYYDKVLAHIEGKN